jgi:predicted phosphodiesterase
MDGRLLAVSDLHVSKPENRRIVEAFVPDAGGDWLIVCGDVGEAIKDIEWALRLLSERFATVLWVPGNHDLWTSTDEPGALRGDARYRLLIELCRRIGVLTPEDPFAVWQGMGGPATVVPLFVLYDYTFGRNVAPTKKQSLARAYEAGVVCFDEYLLHSDPFPTRDAWCEARLKESERRLAARDPDIPTVLVNHFPLVEEPTRVLRHPEFAQWCGTARTADWHRRFGALAAVYGHLHIPRTTWHDGVPFKEVSLGYPREWMRRPRPPKVPCQILPLVAGRPRE